MKYKQLFLILIIPVSTHAQITTDGSLGQAFNLPGPDYQIGADLGQLRGGNLFHSFQDFNLQSFESATFSGPNHIQNVISRVTGGNPSNIDGLFRSTIPNADMYFLNPYGIMFGPNARLDVQGSFHASTADYLRLGDSGRFDASNPNDSILTVASVEKFGFLTNSPASITVDSSDLSVPDQKAFSLIGRELTIDKAQLSAPYGKINLATSVESESTLQGNMTISNNSQVDVSGEGGGSLFIKTGELVVDNSTISANTLGNQDGQQINIQANNVTLLNGAKVTGDTLGIGQGTDIEVNATEQITVSGVISENMGRPPQGRGEIVPVKGLSGFFARSGVNDDDKSKTLGDAGNIHLQANFIEFSPASMVSSSTYGTGNSGNISVTTEHLQMENATITASSSVQGQGGKITVVADRINLKENANIESITGGRGHAGSIDMRVQSLTLEDVSKIRVNTIGHGNAGNLSIHAKEMQLMSGSVVNSTTFGAGNGGNIQIKVTGKLLVTGQAAGHPNLNTRITANANGRSGIPGWTLNEPTQSTGHGGTITIETRELALTEGGQIQSLSQNVSHSAGPAGHIIVQVQGTLLIDGFRPEESPGQYLPNSGIYSNSLASDQQAGPSGNITLEAEQLILRNGGMISSDTNNSSKGGDLDIRVNTLNVDGQIARSDLPTGGLFASSSDHKIDAGTAGNIIIEADTIFLRHEGEMTTAAQNAGGGNMTVRSGNLLYLHDGTITTSVHGGTSDGGNITIENPQFVVLNQGQIKAQADAGHGGNIRIAASQFIKSYESLVSASSRLGLDGNVEIDSPNENVAEGMLTLSSEMVDASRMMKKPCKAMTYQERKNRSQFIVQPLAGSPASPYGLQPSRLPKTSSTKRPQQTSRKITTHQPRPMVATTCKPSPAQPKTPVKKENRVIPEQLF